MRSHGHQINNTRSRSRTVIFFLFGELVWKERTQDLGGGGVLAYSRLQTTWSLTEPSTWSAAAAALHKWPATDRPKAAAAAGTRPHHRRRPSFITSATGANAWSSRRRVTLQRCPWTALGACTCWVRRRPGVGGWYLGRRRRRPGCTVRWHGAGSPWSLFYLLVFTILINLRPSFLRNLGN